MPDYAKNKPICCHLVMLSESGNRGEMALTEQQVQERIEHNACMRNIGLVDVGGTNIEATKGYVDMYSLKTGYVSTNQIYLGKKGFYIKKDGRKWYLSGFEIQGGLR